MKTIKERIDAILKEDLNSEVKEELREIVVNLFSEHPERPIEVITSDTITEYPGIVIVEDVDCKRVACTHERFFAFKDFLESEGLCVTNTRQLSSAYQFFAHYENIFA